MMNQRIFISKARSILADNAGIRKLPHQRSGKFLDESRLGLVCAGETRVFQKPIKRQFNKYHIALVMDASGSMLWDEKPSKLEYAVWSTHALAHALQECGADADVIMFNEKCEIIPEKMWRNVEQFNGYAHRHCKSHGGINHDGGAIRFASEHLMASQAPGKIILVLSDGQPACGGCGSKWCAINFRFPNQRNQNNPAYRDAFGDGFVGGEFGFLIHEINRARKAGITTLGIGVLCDTPTIFYGAASTRAVYNLNDLYGNMAQLLEKNIIRG